MEIQAIKSLTDNYIWAMISHQKVTIVDPGSAAPVLEFLKHHRHLNCDHVLITHHHYDHTGGIAEIHAAYPQAQIHGPKLLLKAYNSTNVDICVPTQNVSQKTTVTLRENEAPWQIIKTPGHTLDHLCFYTPGYLFCGDTLFSAGCGRLLEGTAKQLFDSLKKIAKLPDKTKIYPAHEYTLDNIQFAEYIEPENKKLQAYKKATAEKIQAGTPSLPSTIQIEKDINPFLRCHLPNIHKRIERLTSSSFFSSLEVFTALRKLKDHFTCSQ